MSGSSTQPVESTDVTVDWSCADTISAVLAGAGNKPLPLHLFGSFDYTRAPHVATLMSLNAKARQTIFEQSTWANWGTRGINHAVLVLAYDWIQSQRFAEALTLFDDLLTVRHLAPRAYSLALWAVQHDNNRLGLQLTRARAYLAASLRHGAFDPAIFHNAACVYAELGDPQGMVVAVKCALRHQYARSLLEADPVLAPSVVDLLDAATDVSTVLLRDQLKALELTTTVEHSPQRIAQRALVVAAIAWRASLPGQRPLALPMHYDQACNDVASMRHWLTTRGLDAALEPDEVAFFDAPLPTNMTPECIHRSWSIEAAAMLGWYLGRIKLPQYQQQLDAATILAQLGPGTAVGDELLATAALRPTAAIQLLHRQLCAVHWRMVEWQLRPDVTLDLAAMTQRVPGFDMGYGNIAGDLLIAGKLIGQAHPSKVRRVASIILERYRATAWLTSPTATLMTTVDTLI